MIFAYIFHHGENRNEKPEMNVKRNYLHLFHFRYWQHVTTYGIVKNDTFPEILDCVYVTRVICTYVILWGVTATVDDDTNARMHVHTRT